METRVQAAPTKWFFIDMLTRDIALEDAVLDLVDNSIDSLLRMRGIQPSADVFFDGKRPDSPNGKCNLSITLTKEKFTIEDNCGGIDRESAERDVFRFGKTIQEQQGALSVYGIGLKRAVFKLGKDIEVQSKTIAKGFKVKIDVDDWLSDDDDGESDWTFPIETIPAAKSRVTAGTRIVVKDLNDEIKLRLDDGTLIKRLSDDIAITYSLFLGRFIEVTVNERKVLAQKIPVGGSDEVSPAVETFKKERTSVYLMTGLAARPWKSEKAGWYILCNGRVVVTADKSKLTGWGTKMGSFQPKYRGFLGVAFFFSKYPEDLPWTTTKRGLNRESEVYQLANNKMHVIARPILRFLDRMYPSSTEIESEHERNIAANIKQSDFSPLRKQKSTFSVPEPKRQRKRKTSIQFEFDTDKIELVKRTLGKPHWSARSIGKYALEYLIEQECTE